MSSILTALVHHYLNYLRQPAVFITALVILGSIFLLWFENKKLGPLLSKPENTPGCYRLGLYGRSNLDNNQPRQSKRNSSIGGSASVTGEATIKALFTYPIKSCRGVELKASEVLATGLKYDRLFTFAQRKRRSKAQRTDDERSSAREASSDGDHEWVFITQRECPRLAALETELWVPHPRRDGHQQNKQSRSSKGRNSINAGSAQDSTDIDEESDWAANGGCLIVRFPYDSEPNLLGLRSREVVTFRLPLAPTAKRGQARRYTSESVVVWKDNPTAINVSTEIDEAIRMKLQRFLGVKNPLALFRVDETNLRHVTRSLPKDRPNHRFYISFADAFPVNLLNVASVRAVNDMLPEDSDIKGKLDARRFRANIYITGPPAYAEETWKRLDIGRCVQPRSRARRDRSPSLETSQQAQFVETDGEYYVACRTARCKLVNVDPDTGDRDGNEPDNTLRKNRDVDAGASPHPVLGMQMIPFFPQGVLRVGDAVEVLERGEHVYEKMFK